MHIFGKDRVERFDLDQISEKSPEIAYSRPYNKLFNNTDFAGRFLMTKKYYRNQWYIFSVFPTPVGINRTLASNGG